MSKAWHKKLLTGAGTFVVVNGACEFGGIICQAAGTSTTAVAYDALSAVAAGLLVASTSLAAANDFVSPTKAVGGGGLRCTTGLTVVIGGTGSPTVWALWR